MERKKGSITIFMALILSLIVALVCSSLESVRMAAARTQILCGMDVGLYSLFAGYDKDLLDEYDLFFLDGGYGSSVLKPGRMCDTFRDYMEPVLKQNYQKLVWRTGGLTAYALATDNSGGLFYGQAVEHIKKTLGVAGVQLLMEKTARESQRSQEAADLWESAGENQSLSNYDNEMTQAAQKSHEASIKEQEANGEIPDESGGGQGFQDDSVGQGVNPKVENPIPVIRRIQRMGLLGLVLPQGQEVSDKALDLYQTVSHRNLQEGMGSMETGGSQGFGDQVLFQEYIMKKCGNFRKPASKGLAYETEYILHGKSSDAENLKAVAAQLLLIREGINLGFLLMDAEKMAQAQALALGICSAFLIPPAAGIVKMVLVLCWSFAESVLDVKNLFQGHKVPVMKNAGNWQLSLSNLASFLERSEIDKKTDESGLDYEGYLRVLLLMEQAQTLCVRCMDVIEHQVRSIGRSGFSMDCCVGAAEMAVDVEANHRKTYSVTREYSYV